MIECTSLCITSRMMCCFTSVRLTRGLKSCSHPRREEPDVLLDMLQGGCAAEGDNQCASWHPPHCTLHAQSEVIEGLRICLRVPKPCMVPLLQYICRCRYPTSTSLRCVMCKMAEDRLTIYRVAGECNIKRRTRVSRMFACACKQACQQCAAP